METMRVVKAGIYYLLYNLTIQKVLELQNDPHKRSQHFNYCIETGTNICLLVENDINAMPSTSASVQTPCTSSSMTASDASLTATTNFDFLCRSIEKKNYIYGIKFDEHPWYYFEEHDSMSFQHSSLPASLDISISRMASTGTITISLDEAQARQYFENGKFMFKNKELKTYLAIVDEQIQKKEYKASNKGTNRMVFISGQTNPLLFLNEFEECRDIKSDNDKMWRILHFVDECHKGEFTELYFNGDWHSVKCNFLSLYTVPFVENKKRDLNVDFNEDISLRSFVDCKLTSLSKYTTLPFLNQIEIVINDLPTQISSLFIMHEQMTKNKTEILNFCDSIQDLVQNFHEKSKDPSKETHQESGQSSNRMEMEVFTFTPEEKSILPTPSRGRGRGRGGRGSSGGLKTKRGSILKNIVEGNESSDGYSFLEEMDESSRSSWNETN